MPHRHHMRRSALLITAAASLALVSCTSTDGGGQADPLFETAARAPEFGALEIGIEGVELGVGVAVKTDEGSVRSRFTARSIDGGATRVLRLALELWVDMDDDGQLDDDERATILDRREPNGTPSLTLPFEVPFENGRPLRFVAVVETTVGEARIPGDFALP